MDVKDLKKSIVESLDGTELEIYPQLPYLLQDLWEFGADPSTMLALIKDNIDVTKKSIRVLDLGCGKGAVSVLIAKELKCTIKGIDAMPEFIESAKKYAEQHQVGDLCDFEVGDIRNRIGELMNFDLIILGAIGPILGDIKISLTLLSQSLNSPGYVLLDDGYMPDESTLPYDRCLRKTEFYEQIRLGRFEIIQEIIFDKSPIANSDDHIYKMIKKRAQELMMKFPDMKKLFEEYIKSQEFENQMLNNELITGTWLLKLKIDS